MFAVSAGAGRDAYPKRDGIGRVCRNRRYAREEQCRKRNKAAAACHSIQRATERSGEEKKDYGVKGQTKGLSQDAENQLLAAAPSPGKSSCDRSHIHQ